MLHETVVTDGIASMPHAISIPVPAGQTVELAPGGYHGMLMGLTTALKEGDVVLVAGKGHEDYQIVGNRRLDYSDRVTVARLLGAVA